MGLVQPELGGTQLTVQSLGLGVFEGPFQASHSVIL